MTSKRTIINSFRKKLKEVDADSTYTNQEIYVTLLEHARWLIKREISGGRIYSNSSFFQTLRCQEIIETSTIEECCPIKTKCKIYRTKNKMPEMWIDNDGPVVKGITSVDGSTDFYLTTPTTWQNKKNDPYQKMAKSKYAFFSEGYFWFPEYNPHRVNIVGFYTDDIGNFEQSCCDDCLKEEKDCIRFLDTPFMVPGWLEAEMISKALQQYLPSKQMQEDSQIDKNTNRKN